MDCADNGCFIGFLLVKDFSKSEIGDFEGSVFKKYVFGFNIPVDNTLFFQIATTLKKLFDEVHFLLLFMRESMGIDIILQIASCDKEVPMGTILKKKVNVLFGLLRVLKTYNILVF